MIMAEKPFALGLIVGRFQTLHLGHADMIEKALAVCGRVGIFVGSSQESGTEKNPYSYEMRKRMLEAVFPGRLEIRPLPDRGLGNNSLWGQYVLENAQSQFSSLPDLVISGREERRTSWFDESGEGKMAELIVPKSLDISATALRCMLAEDERLEWQRYTPQALHGMYDEMREKVLASLENTRTESI